MTTPNVRESDQAPGGSAALDGSARSGRLAAVVKAVLSFEARFLRVYHRHEVTTSGELPDGPVLFVANHGFGGIVDLNVFATLAALAKVSPDRDVTILSHQLAWTLKVGRIVEAAGARPAEYTCAIQAFERGNHVLVFPGGDVEQGKSFADRDKIVFSGRRGFARLAVDGGVPIVPVVTAGAGESLLVLSDGQRLARALRLDRTLRVKAWPVSVSLPWGLSVGVVGLVPYLPLPTKLTTAVLDPIWPAEGEPPDAFGDRVETAMQTALSTMTAGRTPLLG
jgi:1-acyl-sn-glycerol-3-phosphate acyltransferase